MAQCEYSYKKGNNDDTVRCKLLSKNGDCCAFVKFCRVTQHWENNGTYKNCPIRRKGQELKEENKNG
jgi:hypothetical protein